MGGRHHPRKGSFRSTWAEEGVKKLGIAIGTAFEDLDPIGFRCPVCRSRIGAFTDIGPRSKASGFEENLNFGLGVNRLTPGQKKCADFWRPGPRLCFLPLPC